MGQETKQIATKGRDCFNTIITPIRNEDSNIKKAQDLMNDYINRFIDGEFVWVKTCMETGKIANPYCPNVQNLKWKKGEEPTEICTFHKKPGAVIYKVPDNMTVPAMMKRFGYPIIIAPIMVPSDGIEINVDEDHYVARGLNRIIKSNSGNGGRLFGFGNWEPPTLKRVNRPYLREESGRFELAEFNPVWIDTLDRRIGQRAERQYTSVVTLIDHCSTHTGMPGHWNAHPWNGNNNVNGTATWQPSIYHFYEEEWQHIPGIQETAEYIEKYIRFLVQRLDKKYKPYIIWEITNEGQAGYYFNKLIRDMLRNAGVKENWRVLTSLGFHFYDSYIKEMDKFLNYSIHGINTWDKYIEAKKLVRSGVRFLPSEDGEKPISAGSYKEMVRRMLEDGALGYESNERPFWYDNVFDPDLWEWHRIKMIGDGWKQFLAE